MKKLIILCLSVVMLASFKKDAISDNHASGLITGTDAATSDCTGTTVERIVCASTTFIASLTPGERDTTVLAYNQTNAARWSNLPCLSQCHDGVQLGKLTPIQLAYAKAVLKAAMGTSTETGYDQVMQIVATDDVLGSLRKGYSSGNYFIAFLGTPTTTGTWQLQFGGHHMAVSLTFKNGAIISASPFFIGLEPISRTSGGHTYAPLNPNHTAMVNMLASLSTAELAKAKLSESFNNVVVGPGADGKFPAKAGIKCSSLTGAQKALVLAAIRVWVKNADDATAAKLMAIYTKEINDTYIAYSGNTSLSHKADYVRIDGPGAWIEFICQPGAIFPEGIHYHTIYRDHVRDYGGQFTF